MTAFISHSFQNQAEFGNVTDTLAHKGVPFWNPAEVKAGSSLRDQLRKAVEQCSVCIFVATHSSLKSSWCGAELGAFWGAGKPIIVYIADSSLSDEDLPPIVQGDVWEKSLFRIAERARELISQAPPPSTGAGTGGVAQVGAMTAEQLQKLIAGAVSLALAGAKVEGQATSPEDIGRRAQGAAGSMLEGIKAAGRASEQPAQPWRKALLWVDDRLGSNVYERRAFEAMGIEITQAPSTQEALDILSKQQFAAIISDMGRKEGPREGYVLLEALRATDSQTPFFIYTASNTPAHQREAAARGAQGTTNNPQELFELVIKALPTDTDGGEAAAATP